MNTPTRATKKHRVGAPIKKTRGESFERVKSDWDAFDMFVSSCVDFLQTIPAEVVEDATCLVRHYCLYGHEDERTTTMKSIFVQMHPEVNLTHFWNDVTTICVRRDLLVSVIFEFYNEHPEN